MTGTRFTIKRSKFKTADPAANCAIFNAGKAPDVGIVPVVGFNFDGRQMALTGYEDKRRVVLIYETETGRKVKTFRVNDENDPVATMAISAHACC